VNPIRCDSKIAVIMIEMTHTKRKLLDAMQFEVAIGKPTVDWVEKAHICSQFDAASTGVNRTDLCIDGRAEILHNHRSFEGQLVRSTRMP
jgi:hypothetical protein